MRQVVLQGVKQQYNLKRSSARRTLALTISGQGLVVHAPWSLPLIDIEHFMLDKSAWVNEKLVGYVSSEAARISWGHGMTLGFMGEAISLEVGAHIKHIALIDNVMYVPELAGEALKSRVLAWYQAQALVYFDARLRRFLPLLPRRPSALKLTSARTRWGSCTRDGVVRLNWRLIQASNAEIDYVLAHELAHLTHMNHSAKFWQELGRIYPDYHVPHKLLRIHGHRYQKLS